MNSFSNHLIDKSESVRNALKALDLLAADAVLFVVDKEFHLVGSLTDGDLRRGFIKGLGFEDSVLNFIQENPVFIKESSFTLSQLEAYRSKNYKVVPILNEQGVVIDVLNFRLQTTLIPADAILMAGGEGKRLRPLTEKIPKPLLEVGGVPIIERNIDRLINVGIKKITLSVNYLGDQIKDYFADGSSKGISIEYVTESSPLGTIGSILLVENFQFDDIIVMNSDLLTNLDFADFYKTYKESGADMAVASTSYHVDVPYAVLETDTQGLIKSMKEKPRYTYYSNAGIYIINKKLLSMIPRNSFFDITDLIDKLMELNYQIVTYPINGYWLDIGRHEEYLKAQEDIKHIKF
jgi:dTDP-glucose pyrophosphorylase